MNCGHRLGGEVDGLVCTREAHDGRGHVYVGATVTDSSDRSEAQDD